MTSREELRAKLDTLSDAALERVAEFIERQEFAERQDQALLAFAEGWTPEESVAFEQALSRRMKLRDSEAAKP